MTYSALSVKKDLRSGQRKVPGEHWPTFVYENYRYDPTEPWQGLFRGHLLVLVRFLLASIEYSLISLLQAYKHIFTSPSSVDGEAKATRSGNARIHGMTAVTLPSIAYVATQVNFCFGLSDASLTYSWSGSLCVVITEYIFPFGQRDGHREVLQLCYDFAEGKK